MHHLAPGHRRRQIAAALVLVATFLTCLWIGTYTVPSAVTLPHTTTPLALLNTPRHTPSWAVPLAIVVGIGGAIVALRILRPPRTKP